MTKTEGQIQSRKHEDRLAKTLGGSRNAGSGSFWVRKGDVTSDLYLAEHKWTSKLSFSLKAEVIEKAMTEALLAGRVGLFALHMNGRDYIMMEESDWLELNDKAQLRPPEQDEDV